MGSSGRPFDKCITDGVVQRYTAYSIRWETGIGMDGLYRASSIRNFVSGKRRSTRMILTLPRHEMVRWNPRAKTRESQAYIYIIVVARISFSNVLGEI